MFKNNYFLFFIRKGGIFKNNSRYHHDNWKILDFIQLTNLCQHDLIWFNIFSWLLYFYNAFLNYMIIFFEFLLTLNRLGRGAFGAPPRSFFVLALSFLTLSSWNFVKCKCKIAQLTIDEMWIDLIMRTTGILWIID